MLALFECVAEAVMARGVRGLAELVPAGGYLYDVANDALKRYRDRRRADDLRDEVAKAALASAEDARRAAEEVARRVAAQAPIEDRLTLELYLTQIPGCVRQSMKRTDDPTGRSVPADFALNSAEDFARLLPHRVPHFRPGADLPGRSGWTLDELLGAGGFGEVWLARHTFIPNRRGAVKFCTDPVARQKLTSHEGKVIARVMARGDHPNVVPLLDAVLDGDAPWLMYEYVGGGNLCDLVHAWQGRPPAERESLVAGALHQLAAAVGTFHRLDPPIVHRDLKPSNILVRSDEGRGTRDEKGSGSSLVPGPSSLVTLKITDFGIGGVAVEYMRTHSPRGLSLMTGWLETSLRGSYTPLYASPQQRAGAQPDPRDDVHALGVIGYQLLTGRLDQGPGIDAAEDLREAGVTDGLIALLTRCVAQKPERRPKDAAELAEKLTELHKPAAAPAPVETRGLTPPGSPKQSPPAAAPKAAEATPKSAVAAPPPQPKPAPPPPVARPTKHAVTVPGQWFSRPAGNGNAEWSGSPVKLPGEVTAKPDEAYRLALDPARTTDGELARLRALAGLTSLEAVDLSGCGKVTDAGLAHVAALPGLKALGLADTPVTDSGVALLLTRFPNLEALSLAGAEGVSRSVVPYLARLRKLKVLSLPPRADTVDVRAELAKRLPGCKLV